MIATYAVHIVAGSLALIAGYIALFSSKGATLHRRAGMVFVYSMLTMCSFGIVIAAVRGAAPKLNIPAGSVTAYLVITSLLTVRPRGRSSASIDRALMFVAFAIAAVCFSFATAGGFFAAPLIMFGLVAFGSGLGDLRMIRGGGVLEGAKRIKRHLWRMTYALFVAAMSFFIGQAKVIPKPIRIPGLLAIPVLVVLVTLLYWLWRMRANGGRAILPVLNHASTSRAS